MGGHKRKTFGLSTGKVGAISELIVCADLLKKGWEVFRTVSQSCSCDLIVIKNKKILRIEVRTGRYRSPYNTGTYFKEYKNILPKQSMFHYPVKQKDMDNCDIFAIVTLIDGKVHYEPELKD